MALTNLDERTATTSMVWARMDDKRVTNRKLREAGLAARGLDEAAINHSAAEGTDGFVADEVVDMLGAAHREPKASLRRLVERLVSLGRWHRGADVLACEACAGRLSEAGTEVTEPTGYWIHDYLEFNPSRAEVDAEKERKKMAGAKGAAKRWGMAPAMAEPLGPRFGSRDGPSRSHPEPHPPPPNSDSRPPLADPEEEDSPSAEILAAGALRVIAERRLERTPSTVGNPEAWLTTCKGRLVVERWADALSLVALHPGADAEHLADLLEPPVRTPTAQVGGPVVPAPFEPDESEPAWDLGRERIAEAREALG